MIQQNIIAAAKSAADRWHIPASVSLAQFALESAWGTKMPNGSNNPFGIKASGNQPSVIVSTHEYVNGRYVSIMAHFRKFANFVDAFDAHAQLLAHGSAYATARKFSHAPKDFANALTGHYATDPHYGQKLIQIMDEYNLYQYDVAS
jgi:flagellum-specific peptidoglycan hydrolase FlgJ